MPGTSPSTAPPSTGAHDAAAGEASAAPGPRRFGRRALLTSGAVGAGVGAAIGIATALGVQRAPEGSGAAVTAGSREAEPFGGDTLPCHGPHQAGIVTAPAAHVRYVAYALREGVDRAALTRLFRILTGDVEGLTAGVAPLADSEPELAERPSKLTVTVGVGPGLVARAGATAPGWLAPLPAFERDRLDGAHDGGDLLILIQADDPLPLAHAARMIDRELRSFVTPLWSQQGFRQARGSEADGTTMRNLMGQIDGTVNPDPSESGFEELVWIGEDGPAWLRGGSALVLRRIRMELDTWDQIGRVAREQTIGRRLSNGSPLTAPPEAEEHTPIDFEAKDAKGLPVIPSFAHARRAHSEDPSERIFRRGANYDEGGESGLLFACYQRNPLRQFVPIQRRLDELDLLNEWVTHTGSAVFAILPGFEPGELIGAALLEGG
ncbi:Dyp-type peroxidase [Leucobacter massiliensis]|uniref:Peroxidase n=1 Tax=Leucobacter massiliensis TaxID=1686285 RepID=A0A2S9QMG7_9MICO|nr:Dyp-type peroxidase [Leucobacter massiliensis]PRI10791.1 peroxidase [Leucobacter massiliensis]